MQVWVEGERNKRLIDWLCIFSSFTEGYERLAQSKEKADAYDMFADDDEDATVKPSSDELNTVLGPNSNAASQSSSDALSSACESEFSLLLIILQVFRIVISNCLFLMPSDVALSTAESYDIQSSHIQ